MEKKRNTKKTREESKKVKPQYGKVMGKEISKKRKSFLELVKGTSPKGNQTGNLGNRESYSNIFEIEAEFN